MSTNKDNIFSFFNDSSWVYLIENLDKDNQLYKIKKSSNTSKNNEKVICYSFVDKDQSLEYYKRVIELQADLFQNIKNIFEALQTTLTLLNDIISKIESDDNIVKNNASDETNANVMSAQQKVMNKKISLSDLKKVMYTTKTQLNQFYNNFKDIFTIISLIAWVINQILFGPLSPLVFNLI